MGIQILVPNLVAKNIGFGGSDLVWAWGSKFADLNNDGWSDLVVANGYISNRRNDDL